MDHVGVGVVGCGFVGYGAHVPAFSSVANSRLVAVADPDSGRREKAANKYRVKTYGDYAELVKDADIDAVVVAVPTPLHAQVALAAINAGKHVLCEMPLAANLAEADEIIDAAVKKGVCLMPSLTFRFTPTFIRVKEMIGKGDVGQISGVIYREFIPAKDLAKQWPPGSWVWDLEQSGGPLFTLAVWSIDLFRWLLDTEITQVSSTTKYTELAQFGGTLGYDAYASVKMANGVVGCLQYSGSVNESATSCSLEVVGSSTSVIKADGNETVTLFGEDPRKTEWNVKEPGPRMWGHLQQDEHFVRCLLEGRSPMIAPEDGRKAMEVAVQIAEAS